MSNQSLSVALVLGVGRLLGYITRPNVGVWLLRGVRVGNGPVVRSKVRVTAGLLWCRHALAGTPAVDQHAALTRTVSEAGR
jgi:hypothetical protein